MYILNFSRKNQHIFFRCKLHNMSSKETSFLTSPTGILSILIILYLGQDVFIPLSLSLLCALSVYPVVRYLEQKGWSKSMAILPPILAIGILFVSVCMALVWILNDVSQKLPGLWPSIENTLGRLSVWMDTQLGISVQQQLDFIEGQIENLKGKAGSMLIFSLTQTASVLIYIILIPVLIFLQLYHRTRLLKFLISLLPEVYKNIVYPSAHKAVYAFYRYIQGILIVYTIVGILNSLGLWALGIPHALLFGFMAAILTAIPFAGIILGSIPPLILSILMYDSWLYPLGVISIFTFVQYLEANLIFPVAVGNRLQLNALAVIVVMLAGAVLWGGMGLIIFLPALAIFKVIAGEIDSLKPWAVLMGDEES